MALCCLLQMRMQTFPVRHVMRVAADTAAEDYSSLLTPWAAPQTRIVIGRNNRQHANHLDAIRAEPDYKRFDLFFKIDDDDFYNPAYVLHVVDDWKTRRWNVSAAASSGAVHGGRVGSGVLPGLGPIPEEGAVARFGMPGTLVFDRKGLDCLLAVMPGDAFEHGTWRRAWLHAKLDVALRTRSNYVYHVHRANASTAHWFEGD